MSLHVRATAVGIDSLEDFIGVGTSLQARDPAVIPPLTAVLAQELGGASVFASYGRQQLFLAVQSGQTVGRIAALVNPRLTDGEGVPFGQFGYFEATEDPEVARALFEAGAAWLRAQGCKHVLGPMNGGAHRLHRLMVSGFEREPFLFEPRNPVYYPRLFEAWGMRPVHRWFSYEQTRDQALSLGARLGRVIRARPLSGRIEVVNPRDIPTALARLHPLLDGLWSGHIGYAPVSAAEFAEVFAGALAIMGERDLYLYVEDGRDLGCAFMCPDYAAQVRTLRGDASGWASWLGGPLPPRLIMHTLALLPEARLSGAATGLLEHLLRQFEADGYQQTVAALVVEGKFERQFSDPTRAYALYGRPL